MLRPIARTVFYPVPRVDSVLVRMRRRAGRAGAAAASPALRALVAGAFAHRRKTAVGSLSLSGGAGSRSREQLREALRSVGHEPDVRAERLSAPDFRVLARELGL